MVYVIYQLFTLYPWGRNHQAILSLETRCHQQPARLSQTSGQFPQSVVTSGGGSGAF